MITLADAFERLKKVDEISLMEVLEISSEDLVDRFQDVIESKFGLIAEELEWEDTDEDE